MDDDTKQPLPVSWPFPIRHTRTDRPVYPVPDTTQWPEALL